jgi:type II secretory pathway component PulF
VRNQTRSLSERDWGRLADRLARLLDAGIPLLEALHFLAERGTVRERFHAAKLSRLLREGCSLSSALQDLRPPSMMLALVEVGEQNGDLAGSLFRTAAHCAERTRWRQESRQAMAYPLLVLIVLLLLCLFLLHAVIPRFADLYAGMDLSVTGATRLLFSLAKISPLPETLLLLLTLLCGVPFALSGQRRRRSSPQERASPIRIPLTRLPLIGRWLLLDRSHEWTATLGLLLDGGLPLISALEVQETLPLHPEVRAASSRIRGRVLAGERLGEALAAEELEPALALSVRVAELTGDLARTLLAVERDLAERRKQAMKAWMQALEPLLLLIAGALVGLVALLMLWPMLDLMDTI